MQRVASRNDRRMQEAARQSQARPLERLQQLEEEVNNLTAALEELDQGEPSA